ncbi:MAG TPA: DUF4838 domain-containing protein [Actinopolymorphaceae bacterium]|jgi:hypothetical protein
MNHQSPTSSTLTRRSVLRAGVALGGATLATAATRPAEASPNGWIRLANNGRTSYRVFVGTGEDVVVRQAAKELAQYLHRITGAKFRVVSGQHLPAGRLLVVGRKNALARKLERTIDYDALSDDGFALRTLGHNVLIAGASSRGTLYGAYWVLDRLLGVRWFAPDHTVIPRSRDVVIRMSELNGDRVPRFRFRCFLAGDANDPAYRQHNMLNGRRDQYLTLPCPEGIDTWSGYWPEEVEWSFTQVVTDESLWYGGQIKMMDPRTREEATKALVKIIRDRVAAGEDKSAPFFQEDRGWTPDPDSQAFADAHGGALSAPLIDMVNDVAARVREQIPGARLETQAYQFSFKPPTGLKVSDAVVLTIAPIHADFGRSLFSEANAEIGSSIETWTGLAKNIVLWDYLTSFSAYILPFPNWWSMCDSIKALAQYPTIQGYFGEGAWNAAGTELSYLRAWVISRLLWDPTLDADTLIREFVNGYYGKAGPFVYEYLTVLRQSMLATNTALPCYTTVGAGYLTFDAMRRADELLEKAERAVRHDAKLRKHVLALRLGADYVILVRANEYVRTAEAEGIPWDPDLSNRVKRFEVELEAAGLTQYAEPGGTPEDLLSIIRIAGVPATPPETAAGLPASDWIDYQEPTLKLYAPVTTIMQEDAASNTYTVKMPGNVPDWGVQLPLNQLPTEGAWKLYVSARADIGSAEPDAAALYLGVYPATDSIPVPVSTLSDGKYHELPMPGTYQNDGSLTLYVAPPSSGSIDAVYIDRVFAVKA